MLVVEALPALDVVFVESFVVLLLMSTTTGFDIIDVTAIAATTVIFM